MTEAEGEEFRRVAKLQYQEIEKLRALIAWKDQELGRKDQEMDVLVGWIAGDADAHSALMAIYADPRQNTANKTRAAGLALPFEKAKPPATVNTNVWSLAAYLDQQALLRKEALAREQAAKTIEHQPRKPLDFNEPTPGTVLGAGCGHHQAYHEDGDPAE
jgi:hypothetical protein